MNEPISRYRAWATACVAGALVIALPGCTPAEAADAERTSATVVAVVDGDTVDVETAAGEERVRLIGIDTPEISRDAGADECYAQEARDYLDRLLYRQDVELVSDPTQDDVDRHGRLLRHVLIDGESAAQLAIESGAGIEYTYDHLYTGHSDHAEAQQHAQDAGAGIWSKCQ